MKVAIVTASVSRNGGGVPISASRLVRSLALAGFSTLEVLGFHDEFTRQDMGWWSPVIPKTFPSGLSVSGIRAMGRALRRGEPDLVHLHGIWTYGSLAVLNWSRATHKPHVSSAHGMLDAWALQNSRWKKTIFGLLIENAQLRRAACLHALCVSESQSIRAYGLKNAVCVIPNGVDLPEGPPLGPPAWAETLPTHAKVLFYLGRIHPKKGLVNLLQAWGELESREVRNREQWHLVVAGWDQGGHEAELKQFARERGLPRVHFVGPQFEGAKDASFARADAFILPSYSEGLPMAVLEAWAYGLPVLMTPECNLPVGFAAGAALEIHAESESIAQGLANLFSMHDAERQAIGQRGRDLVRRQFTWDRVAAEMHSVYQWLLGGGAPPECVLMT